MKVDGDMKEPKEPADIPWIHIGECPVCVNGLCRVRTCRGGQQGETHFYALCDECEALWLEPDTMTDFAFCDPESPVCPICQQSLYGPHARWSTPADLQGTEWAANAIYALPSDSLQDTSQDEADADSDED